MNIKEELTPEQITMTIERYVTNSEIFYIKNGALYRQYMEFKRPAILIGDIFHRFAAFDSYDVLAEKYSDIKNDVFPLDDFTVEEQGYILVRHCILSSYPSHTGGSFTEEFCNLLVASSNPDIKRKLWPDAKMWLKDEMEYFPMKLRYEQSSDVS